MPNDTFRLVISTKFINGIERFLELDTCTSKSVKTSSQIAQQPLQDGSMFSDHMYRQPATFDVSGSFSLNGRHQYEGFNSFSAENILYIPNDKKVDLSGYNELSNLDGDRLTAIQTVFEYIKNKGLLCTLTTLKGSPENPDEVRFKQRKNMVLTSITWTEKYNSMEYSFSFQEVMQVSMQVYEVSQLEDLYPSISMPTSKSLSKVIQDNGLLYQTIIDSLIDNNYIDLYDGGAYRIKSINYYNEWDADTAKAIGISAAISAGIVAVVIGKLVLLGIKIGLITKVGAVAGITSAIVPVGQVIAITAVVAVAVTAVISGIINARKKARAKRNLKNGFNLIYNYNSYIDSKTYELKKDVDASKLQENIVDITRLKQLLDSVQFEIDKKFDDVVVYELSNSQMDNDSFTAPIRVGQDMFYFTFNRTYIRDFEGYNNDGDYVELKEYSWSIQILDGIGKDAEVITTYFNWSPVTNFMECSANSNILCRDKSTRQYEVYLMCPSLAQEKLSEAEEINIRSTLQSYQLIISKGSIEDAMKKLNTIIVGALENQGFTN